MGIYIKGMEMPTDCAMLLKIFPDGRVGVPVHHTWMETMVVNDAEAVPVPPHGRLGDLDALYESCALDANVDVMASAKRINEYMQLKIDAAPTIIPSEEETDVRR